jgi:membrane protein DedA with SNARE-associated domain
MATDTEAPSRSLAARRWLLDYGVFALFGTIAAAGIYLFLSRDAEFAHRLLEDERYWMPAMFALFVLEGAMLLYFAPSESLVPVALFAVGRSPEDIAVVVGIAVLGATIGQYLLFLLAKRGGRERLLERPWFRVSEERLDRFDGWFGRWGPLVVPVSNSLLFTRGMLTVPAGFAEMDDRQFVALSALGTLSFELVLAGLALGVFEFLGL